jgi:hypothetical protein
MPFAMGAGMVNPGKVAKPGSAFNPGLVYDAGFLEYLGFLCDAGPEIFANPAASCANLAANGIPTQAENLNYPSIGISQLPGTATVTRTITSVADTTVTFTASGIVPEGYEASVNPETITLAPGESASFEATITNVSAPINEWRFGQLVWSGGGYHVSSPVAVRAVTLGTPLEVSGTGADGTLSFDVQFGYSGAYSAAAHGLVPATSSDDTVLQDPDQTYPSADDGAGGVVDIPFVVSGVSVARWSLAIPGDDDIDLYLTNSAGDIVAQSTSGGTDELIELHHPADDTYTMHVHGWSITNPAGLAFSLQSWLVPEASGGSLVIASAPTEAVNATAGTINLTWAGLTPGVSYLGTVSHNDDVGEMAITVVSVDA